MTSAPDAPPATPASERPPVSVVIPCYRQARFLGEAIESALAQRYQNLDIVVVDDGSPPPEDVAQVVARFAGVRYLRQSNRGVAAARNAGLAASRGDYIVFLDADDRLLPGAIDAGLACFAAHPTSAFVYGRFRFMAEDGTPRDVRIRPPLAGDLYGALLRQNFIEMLSTVLFRRAALDEVGGFDTSLRSAEDYQLILRIARCHPTHGHEAIVAEYRRYGRYESSLTHDPALMLRHTMLVLRSQRAHVRGNARYESALASGIRSFQNYYGGELIDETRTLVRQRAWGRALRRMPTLLRYYPRGIVERLVRRAREVLRPQPTARHDS